ncbi:MAG: hypothetical protein IJA87_07990 [Clostridia bacterium]|nr:hypothetical protein [Clostridia bacterium]
MLHEISYIKEDYMYTATLSNGDRIIAFADGTARGDSGKKYRIVTHLDENEEVIIDGWEEINA